MLSEDTKALEFNQYHKSDKEPDEESDADLECLTKNTDGVRIILKNHPQQK